MAVCPGNDSKIIFPVSVRWLAIQERDHALAIATHGRGIYLIDDFTPADK